MYYFAFGSNLNHTQMADRCPEFKFVGPAVLEDYKLVFDGYHKRRKGAIANIVPAKGEQVIGGVYEITDSDLKLLDKFEEVPHHTYYRKVVYVRTGGGEMYDAVTYLRPPQKTGKPSKEYMALIEAGRKDCGIE